jgi:poly-beta-1,6-N-acetyl-D-glucosamine synthase
MLTLPSYVLITPARNEAESIELTIQSVVKQSARPIKWIIVSDGSTDGTDDIVRKCAANHAWIELVRTPERRERHFAGKVQAFNVGYAKVRDLDYDVIGNLDADVSFDRGYFSYLLQKLAEDRSLGLVGTPFKEGTNPPYDYRYVSIEHVSGCCQLFRRECFDEIGGYKPVKGGCIDHIAVVSARMKGWKTRTFTDMVLLHHRQMGTAGQGLIRTRFKNGQKDYVIGNHPVWELFRAAYQTTKKPYVVGSLMLVSGYFWSLIRRVDRPISDELVAFVRREQLLRLRRILTGNRNASNEGSQRPVQHV